jgi:hypothetical protein
MPRQRQVRKSRVQPESKTKPVPPKPTLTRSSTVTVDPREPRPVIQAPEPELQPVLSSSDFDDCDGGGFEPVEQETKFRNLWFIADCKLSQEIRDQLIEDYSNIRSFNRRLFANRSPETLCTGYGVQHMWCDITDPDALEYVRQYVKANEAFTTILVRRCMKNAKNQRWIKDLEAIDGAIDISMRVKDLNKIESLTFDGLVEQLENAINITPPASTIGMLTACSRSLLKKKR